MLPRHAGSVLRSVCRRKVGLFASPHFLSVALLKLTTSFTSRFQRCLDLYLCPRVAKNRLKIQPNELLPPLPSPKVVDTKPVCHTFCHAYASSSLLTKFPLPPAGVETLPEHKKPEVLRAHGES